MGVITTNVGNDCIGCQNTSAINVATSQATLGELDSWMARNEARFCKSCRAKFWERLMAASKDPAVVARGVVYDKSTGTFQVPSTSRPKPGERQRVYRVTVVEGYGAVACTCPHYEFRGTRCNVHMAAVELYVKQLKDKGN